MRILDVYGDKPMKSVCLFLTLDEAKELVDSLANLIEKPDSNHGHINDEEFNHEITVSIYSPSNIKDYNERSQKIILNDE